MPRPPKKNRARRVPCAIFPELLHNTPPNGGEFCAPRFRDRLLPRRSGFQQVTMCEHIHDQRFPGFHCRTDFPHSSGTGSLRPQLSSGLGIRAVFVERSRCWSKTTRPLRLLAFTRKTWTKLPDCSLAGLFCRSAHRRRFVFGAPFPPTPCPCSHSATRSVLSLRPAGTSRLCFSGSFHKKSPAQSTRGCGPCGRDFLRLPSRKAPLALGSRAHSRRVAQGCPE